MTFICAYLAAFSMLLLVTFFSINNNLFLRAGVIFFKPAVWSAHLSKLFILSKEKMLDIQVNLPVLIEIQVSYSIKISEDAIITFLQILFPH